MYSVSSEEIGDMKDLYSDNNIELFYSRDKIRQSLVNYCREYLDLSELELSKSVYLSYIINVLSVLASNLMFYNSSVYREFFLIKARQKESVMNLAAMLGYRVELASAATVPVTVYIPVAALQGVSGSITMNGSFNISKEPFVITSSDGQTFTCKNDVFIEFLFTQSEQNTSVLSGVRVVSVDENNVMKELPVNIIEMEEKIQIISFTTDFIQSETHVEFAYVPDLEPYQFFTYSIPIEGNSVSSVKVFSTKDKSEEEILSEGLSSVALDEWNYVDSMFLLTPEDKAFSYRISDRDIKLFFGNGVLGFQPEPKTTFVIILGLTKGSVGNVISGAINTTQTLTKVNVDGGKIQVEASFVNLSAAYGGKDYPTIEEIRKKAIAHIQTNRRFVTRLDYMNLPLILNDFPARTSIPILKRSDLKQNEISLYMDLIFDDEIVPTRSETLLIPASNTGNEKLFIPRFSPVGISLDEGTEVVLEDALETRNFRTDFNSNVELNFTSNKEWFMDSRVVTLFDMMINETTKTVEYSYSLDSYTTGLKMVNSNFTNTLFIQPTSVSFVKGENDIVLIDLSCLVVDFAYLPNVSNSSPGTEQVECEVVVSGMEDITYRLEKVIDSTEGLFENGIFRFTNSKGSSLGSERPLMYLKTYSYPSGELTFNFKLKLGNNYSIWSAKVVIRKSLKDRMQSKAELVTQIGSQGEALKKYWRIYDVPCLSKEYYEWLNSESNRERGRMNRFDELVIYRIINADINSFRMMTDFVNMKFSNTFGVCLSMYKYNNPTRMERVIAIDPDNIKDLDYDVIQDMDSIAVTNYDMKEWKRELGIPNNISGYLMRYSKPEGRWYGPYFLKVNDILIYEPNDYTKIKMIFNGHRLVPLVLKSPIEIEMDVWIDPNEVKSESLDDEIKKAVIISLFGKFGYETFISRSDIEKAVMSISGVKNCVVLKPEFDIFTNFDLDKLSQGDLIRFVPSLLYTTYDCITINFRR